MKAYSGGIVFWVVFFYANCTFAHDFISISNNSLRDEAMGDKISVFEDNLGAISFDSIVKIKFPETKVITANNRNSTTAVWVKFDLNVQEDLLENKIFEILDFKIDSFELYLPLKEGGYKKYVGGDSYPFEVRNYSHKNYLFDLPTLNKGVYSGYIRIKANEVVGLNFAISNQKTFHRYSLNEYFILSLFYGIVIALAITSLFLFVYLKEKSYLFYSLYIVSLALYFLTRDGLGFQYIWFDFPAFNNYSKPISVFLVLISHIYFVKFYLNLKENSKFYNKVIYFLLLSFPGFAYLADTVLEILPDPLIAITFPFLFLLFFSVKITLKGNIEARFFVVAYIIQFIGFLIFLLAYINLIEPSTLIFYSLNIASAIEIIIFSLALAGKVKKLIKEKEALKDSANKILEQKVIERTKKLEESNNQLDFFVYKASHDIKGPLKSMMGLASLAIVDVEDGKAKEYFEYMLTTARKLDNMVEELLRMGKVKDLEINRSDVNVNKITQGIISSLQHLPNFIKIEIKIDIPKGLLFYTDEILVYSVFQNIIENSIKYLDDSKGHSYLSIKYREEGNRHCFEFEDNGMGIPVTSKEKIFDMFYKVNTNSSGTGLGLYLTKLTVEKLGGSIEISSEETIGTTFVIYFDKIEVV